MLVPIGKCFACNNPLYNMDLPCPHCGYKFTAGENQHCPNLKFGVCAITEHLCNMGNNYSRCNVKNKADSESF